MQTTEAIKNLFLQSGAGWVLWLLFVLSAASVAVFVERWLFFRGKSEDVRQLAAALDSHLAQGQQQELFTLLAPMSSTAAAVVRAGLRLAPRGLVAVERGMQSAVALERKQLEGRLVFLGTLGNNAPFIGLLGTVIGVVVAFDELGRPSGVAQGLGPSEAVMGAIAEALVATAVGIAVALPAVAAYNYFQRRLAMLLDDAETLSSLLLAYLGSSAPASAPEQG
jgi:biopolymer transport protein ExbB